MKAGKNALSETTDILLCRDVSVVSYFISEEAHLRNLGDVPGLSKEMYRLEVRQKEMFSLWDC